MTKNRLGKKNKRRVPKTVLRLPHLDHAKSAVLNSLTSVDAQRGYRQAIEEFVESYCSEPRLSFGKTVVLRYRIDLESRQLALLTFGSLQCAASLTRHPTAGR